MLFNSYQFIFAFLPIVLLVFVMVGRLQNKDYALCWLVAASLFFYGWWNPVYLILMLFSMVFNYAFGLLLERSSLNEGKKHLFLIAGVAVNLGFLGYYKYTNFLVSACNDLFGTQFEVDPILLPLAISFFTFQQIAYLVDARRGETREHSFLHYALFVTFFPQLIAGPIVHHKEMLPQFEKKNVYRLQADHVAIGLTIFFIGLFKKVVLADNVALYATPVFEASYHGTEVSFLEAWGAALAYSCQLYFDFSGYADMAIGSARLFGIQIPINFNSPYKAHSIIDFWRRWHITLSRFLRDYVYFSLGGNRKGELRRYGNLMLTMILGGIWHGAGWTFLFWGVLHGVYLLLNHAWEKLVSKPLGLARFKLWRLISWFITLFAVIIAWVYFRAQTLSSANMLVGTMLGFNTLNLPERMEGFMGSYAQRLNQLGIQFDAQIVLSIGEWVQGLITIAILLLIALWAPNTRQIMANFSIDGHVAEPGKKAFLVWNPTVLWALFISLVSFVALLKTNDVSEFLYFQF